MRYGLLNRKPKSGEYVFGGGMVPEPALQPTGQWDEFLPEYESQAPNGWDTYGCTIFGTVNAVEILEARIWGAMMNYSERFHYNMIPTRPPGGSPHEAAESVRKNGMVPQEAYPMTETFDEYVSPMPVPHEIRAQGASWLSRRSFRHEWLWKRPWWAFWKAEPTQAEKEALFKEALTHSPIGVSVSAWWDDGNGLYIDRGLPNNHWCVMVGWIERVEGLCFKVFDSYDQTVKTLAPGHRIESAKRYHIDENRGII